MGWDYSGSTYFFSQDGEQGDCVQRDWENPSDGKTVYIFFRGVSGTADGSRRAWEYGSKFWGDANSLLRDGVQHDIFFQEKRTREI